MSICTVRFFSRHFLHLENWHFSCCHGVRHNNSFILHWSATPFTSEQVHSAQNGTLNAGPNVSCASPAFKTPNAKVEAEKDGVGRRRKPLQQLNNQHEGEDGEFSWPLAGIFFYWLLNNLKWTSCWTCPFFKSPVPDERRHKVEPMWSIDPALTLSTYGSECRGDEVQSVYSGMFVWIDAAWILWYPAFFFFFFSTGKNNRITENWQIPTAPGSVTAYCTAGGNTPPTNRTTSLVNTKFQNDLLCGAFWLAEIMNPRSHVMGVNHLDYCEMLRGIIVPGCSSRTRREGKRQFGHDVRHDSLRGVQVLQQFPLWPEPTLWRWCWWGWWGRRRGWWEGQWWAF